MRVMVVGGGKVGAHLVDLLSAADNAVVLVESDPERARELLLLGRRCCAGG